MGDRREGGAEVDVGYAINGSVPQRTENTIYMVYG